MENINKSLELLGVPSELSIFNGQIQKKITNQILETITTDYTNVEVTVNPITGKKTAKSVIKTTREYSVLPKEEKIGGYAFNYISGMIHAFGYQYMGDGNGAHELFKPSFSKTLTSGDFAGQTYHFHWSIIKMNKTATGSIFECVSSEGRNADQQGNAITNDLDCPVTIQRRQKLITGTVRIKSTGEYSVTNTRISWSSIRPTDVTKGYLFTNMNIDDLDLAEMCKVVFHTQDRSHETHVENIATDVVISNNKYKGDVFINGIDSESIPYTSLISSIGTKFPQFVQRWHLYNEEVNNSIYGSTWTKKLDYNESNEITIIAGDKFSFDEVTKTLTYDASKSARLWYTFECLPAQGKNEGAQIEFDLVTGTKNII
jgi:hypothetical protein